MKKIIFILSFILILLITNIISKTYFSHDILKVNATSDTYTIIVDLDSVEMEVYKNGDLHKTYPVSGGTYYTPSPLGTWKIISKANWGEGFGGTWMGFNVPWGKYGIHGTDEPWAIGSNASKGCIRMYNEDAEELKGYIPVGTEVTIKQGPYGPYGTGLRTLKPGARGSDVYAIQQELAEQGYYNGYVDGVYGDGMKSAVTKFQKDNNIAVTDNITKDFYNALGIVLMD